MSATKTLYPGNQGPRRGRDSSQQGRGKVEGWRLLLMGTAVLAVLIGIGFSVVQLLEKTVVFELDGQPQELHTFKSTVGEVLVEVGVSVGDKDLVEPGIEVAVNDGMTIKVAHAVPFRIVADGNEVEFISVPAKVEDLLTKAEIALGPLDRTEPARDAMADQSTPIQVVRVEEKELDIDQEIPFQVEQRDDDNLEKGIRRVVSRGSNGIERQRVKVLYEDGQEVKREVLSKETVREPKTQIVAYGTISQVSRGGSNLRFREALMVDSTAYTHTGSRTSTGIVPKVGIVAVDPNVIPMGSRLYIEGYGYATAADRGGAIKGNRVDVFMETLDDCRRWGRRTVKVYILE